MSASPDVRPAQDPSSASLRSPGVAALDHHARLCAHCLAVATAGLSYRLLCPSGRILAQAAILARAARRAS